MDYNKFKFASEKEAIESIWGINYDFVLAKLAVKRLDNTGKPQTEFIKSAINEFQDSDKLQMMEIAQKYLMNQNVTINERVRKIVGFAGQVESPDILSNTKLSHPFVFNLVEQKVNLLLSQEMSIQTEDDEYSKKIYGYMNKKFFRQLKTLGQSAITNGIAWLQVYYDKQGNLKFKHIPSMEVIPFWRDSEHRELDALIRYYTIQQYDDEGVPRNSMKVEYYTDEGVWYYEYNENGMFLDSKFSTYPRGNFSLKMGIGNQSTELEPVQDTDEEIEEFSVMWEKIPFIAFKYNHYEVPLIQWVRSLIDEYDTIASDMSNNIKDFPNSFKEVRGYSGEDVAEFNRNLNIFRTAFLGADDNSGMKIHAMPLEYEGVKMTLERLRKDIYDAGKGIDPQEANFGHASGVAIRYRYMGLMQDCMAMGNEFQEALEKMLYFINLDIALKGGQDYSDVNVDFIFNTDAIMNETETITNIRNSVGILSLESLVAQHPWVRDVEIELERKKKEMDENMRLFGNPEPDSNLEFGSDMTAEAFLEAESKGTGLDLKKRG